MKTFKSPCFLLVSVCLLPEALNSPKPVSTGDKEVLLLLETKAESLSDKINSFIASIHGRGFA